LFFLILSCVGSSTKQKRNILSLFHSGLVVYFCMVDQSSVQAQTMIPWVLAWSSAYYLISIWTEFSELGWFQILNYGLCAMELGLIHYAFYCDANLEYSLFMLKILGPLEIPTLLASLQCLVSSAESLLGYAYIFSFAWYRVTWFGMQVWYTLWCMSDDKVTLCALGVNDWLQQTTRYLMTVVFASQLYIGQAHIRIMLSSD